MTSHDASDWLDPAKDPKADNGHVSSGSPSVDQPDVHTSTAKDQPKPHRETRNRGWRLGEKH